MGTLVITRSNFESTVVVYPEELQLVKKMKKEQFIKTEDQRSMLRGTALRSGMIDLLHKAAVAEHNGHNAEELVAMHSIFEAWAEYARHAKFARRPMRRT